MRNVNSKPHGFTAAGKVTEFRAWPIERADQTLPQRPPGLVYPVGFNSPETMRDHQPPAKCWLLAAGHQEQGWVNVAIRHPPTLGDISSPTDMAVSVNINPQVGLHQSQAPEKIRRLLVK